MFIINVQSREEWQELLDQMRYEEYIAAGSISEWPANLVEGEVRNLTIHLKNQKEDMVVNSYIVQVVEVGEDEIVLRRMN